MIDLKCFSSDLSFLGRFRCWDYFSLMSMWCRDFIFNNLQVLEWMGVLLNIFQINLDCVAFFSSFLRWMHVEIKQQRMNMVYLVYPTHSKKSFIFIVYHAQQNRDFFCYHFIKFPSTISLHTQCTIFHYCIVGIVFWNYTAITITDQLCAIIFQCCIS